jgi:fatty-acid desaturase
MMEPVKRIKSNDSDKTDGIIKLDPPKTFWNLGMIVLAVFFAPLTFSLEAFFLFIVLTYFSLLIGHSAGMHRMMIHRTFNCPKVVERVLIYIGVLVGMSGPFGIIKIHDIRDWAQRKESCPDFFSHTKGYFQDIWWQLTSKFEFDSPPTVIIEPKFADDDFLLFLERTWRWHQLLLAAILFFIGGWEFVVWGVFVRIAVSVVGHWSITYFCHNPGPGRWRVKGAGVQASNISGLGLLTYGECWHNNHHAFPESAKIGLEKGQADPAWWFILLLEKLRLATNIRTQRPTKEREDLYNVS